MFDGVLGVLRHSESLKNLGASPYDKNLYFQPSSKWVKIFHKLPEILFWLDQNIISLWIYSE